VSELKPISKEAIPRAIAKAERYRLLNEPWEAESICRDVLGADPGNQEALVMLLLSLTDQFGRRQAVSVNHAREILPQLRGEYERFYYAGVICERWGKVQVRSGTPGHIAYAWFREAMEFFEKATALSPPLNEDAILRWNACVRLMKGNTALKPNPADGTYEPSHDDEAPPR